MQENTICAPDARTDPLTRELTASYFEPKGTVSLLDHIVHHELRPVGILCCESRGRRRGWSQADRDDLLEHVTLASFETRI